MLPAWVFQPKPYLSLGEALRGREVGQERATKVAKFLEGSLPNADSLQSASSSVVDSRERPALVSKAPDGREPFLLELFCGTAGVSAQFKRAGG